MFYQLLQTYCATFIFALTLCVCPGSIQSTGATEVTQTMPQCLDSSGHGHGTPPAHQGLGSLHLCPHVQENQLTPEQFTASTSGKDPKHPPTC